MGPPFRTSQFSYLEIDRSKEIAIFCGTTFSTFSKSDPILARVSAPQAPETVKEKLGRTGFHGNPCQTLSLFFLVSWGRAAVFLGVARVFLYNTKELGHTSAKIASESGGR
jgi:hypothetical protein